MSTALPDYHGGSIVNLMSSVSEAFGADPSGYPTLRALPADALREARKVVLLVFDGLGHDYLSANGPGGAMHAHLRARITSVFPSTTATAIPVFLTGYAPAQHGFTGWFTYLREFGSVVAVLPFRNRLGGTPLARTGLTPRELSGCAPVFDRIEAPSYVVTPMHISRSDFNRDFSGSASVLSYETLQEMFSCVHRALSASQERSYVYAYWPRFDTLAHKHGVGSHQVRQHFTEIDHAFERFAASLAGTGTAVVATADHGFIDSGPRRLVPLEDHPVLGDALVLPLSGESRLAYCYVHPDRREVFERYVAEDLAHCAVLHRSQDLLRDGWFGIGKMHPRLHDRIGHYTLEMRDNYMLKDWLPGEERYRHIGVHGGTSEREMHVPLIVVKP